MGIHGLLPFVKEATEQVNIKKYAGYTVAVDTYCWLHKGAFACAMQLAKGEPTDQYVRYCMKFVNMLRSYNIKPILVFDGCNLPSKKHVEKSRRERRETFMKKGKQFLREGKLNEARDCFTKCINIKSEMALDVIKAARSLDVDCIVAPYEADAQLAYLNKCGIAEAIITEDSDLVAFGCDKVIVKLDINGNGLEICSSKLDKAMKIGTKYTVDKFRYMCIISGCDYLPSLPGIGLGKARKLFLLSSNPDISQLLKKMPMHLKMKQAVGDDYIEGFHQANNTFLHQLVFDPLTRKLVPLNPYPPEIQPGDISYAGKYIDNRVAYEMALGNLNVNTGCKVAHYVPQSNKPFDPKTPHHLLSIWHNKYKPRLKCGSGDHLELQQRSTKSKQMTVKLPVFKMSEKKYIEESVSLECEQDLALMYGSPPKLEEEVIPETPEKELEKESATQSNQKPKIRRNKFVIHRFSSKERTDLINQGATQNSRFFSSEPISTLDNSEDERDKSKNNSILLAELDDLQNEIQNDQDDDLPVSDLSVHSHLQKFKRSSSLTPNKLQVDMLETNLKEENRSSQKEQNTLELKVPLKTRGASRTGAFSWKTSANSNKGIFECCIGQSSSIESFRSSSKRNSDLETPCNVSSSSMTHKHACDDNCDDLSQESIKLSQISNLYSIDGDEVSSMHPSQSQHDCTSESQTEVNSTQYLISPSHSQQNFSQQNQSLQHFYINSCPEFQPGSTSKLNTMILASSESRLPEFNNTSKMVRCGLSLGRSAPPAANLRLSNHIGRSKNVGLTRHNSKKRKASNENILRQNKMTKFFATTNKIYVETKLPLSPVNSKPECTAGLRFKE
ncbi:exonuclease 1-like isoform X2 [Antedon mediterranea]|uniref:exonuclease 1-like isoform X2 n=1 Tax=Antedon mediterranea TaxID=105859 RepID=UPI003AF51B3D